MIGDVGADGDGKLSFEEFRPMLEAIMGGE
eukprot:SAG22_NODE_330_length_12211_cov_6.451948_15_plen_29_part_01